MKFFLKLVFVALVMSGSIKAQSVMTTNDCEVFFKHLTLFEKGDLKLKDYHQVFDVLISDIEHVLNDPSTIDDVQRLYSVEFMLEYMSEYNGQMLDIQKEKLSIIQEKIKFQKSHSDDERVKNAKQFLEAYIGSKQETVDATVSEVLKIIANKNPSGYEYLALEYLRTILFSSSCPKEINLKYQSLLNKIGDISVLTRVNLYTPTEMDLRIKAIQCMGKKLIKK